MKERFEPEAEALAERIQDETYHIITGAGSAWPEAFYYGMCILEEMQWIRTRPVHASDFFHGTLELVEPGVSVIVFKGEDEYRPLADRVEAFARSYTDKLTVLDAATPRLPGVSGAPAADHLAGRAGHDAGAPQRASGGQARPSLTTRRYYRRVAY